jgi:diacylglycerol kinase (ATP)
MKKRINSFKYAFRGIFTLLKTQTNARIHLAATIIIVSLGFYFSINPVEWCMIIIATTMVWAAEALNSALEFLADYTAPKWHPLIEHAKDVAAGAVLLMAAGAFLVGLLVFLPYFGV